MTDTRRLFYYSDAVKNGHADSEKEHEEPDKFELSDQEHANLIGSLCADGLHRPVLDIDFGAALLPSSSAGHYHLYLDKPLEWEAYKKLLDALAEAGIVSKWYAKFSTKRRMTHVRCPWVKKPEREPIKDERPLLPAAPDDNHTEEEELF